MNIKIYGKRIISLNSLKKFDMDNIQVGIRVINDEAKKVGLSKVGELVLPSGDFGPQSRKNAYGYTYVDKTTPKEYRYISTNWIHPYGKSDRSMIPVDIYRKCYRKVDVTPSEIELLLYENEKGEQFVMVNMDDRIRTDFIKEAINLVLEIYGICYIFDGDINLDNSIKRHRCSWEILPPGEWPSKRNERELKRRDENRETFDYYRLKLLEERKPDKIIEGINGFKGYFAFLFQDVCLLESAIYGNATYIIPKVDWETLSQMTKKELLDEDKVIERIEHRADWQDRIDKFFSTVMKK